jgi:hypothetical protein
MNKPFWIELIKRVLSLANALQYENSARLLDLAISASNDLPDDTIMDAYSDLKWEMNIMIGISNGSLCRNSNPKDLEYDHESFDNALCRLEDWLKENDDNEI